MPPNKIEPGVAVLIAGHLVVASGYLLWIFSPCGTTCAVPARVDALVVLLVGLAVIALGFALAASRWVKLVGSARQQPAAEEKPWPPWIQSLKLDTRVTIVGLPSLILGAVLTLGALIADVHPGSEQNFTLVQRTSATDLVLASVVVLGSGLVTVLVGYLLDWWAELDSTFLDKPLALSGARASMEPVLSAMLREDHLVEPEPEAKRPPQPRIRPRREGLTRMGQGKLFVGLILAMLVGFGLGVALVMMAIDLGPSL